MRIDRRGLLKVAWGLLLGATTAAAANEASAARIGNLAVSSTTGGGNVRHDFA